jgi:DNA polymerase-1
MSDDEEVFIVKVKRKRRKVIIDDDEQPAAPPKKPKALKEPASFPIGWAIQQEKNDSVFRRVLIAPQGYDLLEFDAAGQEFRWMAIQSGDPTMLNLCQKGEDPHSYMGASIYHEDYRELIALNKAGDKQAKHRRKLGKLANLSLQYRTSAPRLLVKARVDYDLDMSLPEAQLIHGTYPKVYTQVPVYWRVQPAKCRRLGYAETLAGSRVQLIGDWSGKMKWPLESTSINYPIQGTGADQKYLAMSVLKDYMVGVGGRMVLDLHDGLYWLVPKAKSMKALHDCKWLLDNLPYKRAWDFTPPVPLPWDAKIGPCWGMLEEVK